MTRDEIIKLQRHLNAHRLGPVLEDGIYGPATAQAYQKYLQLYTPIEKAPTPIAAKPWWTSRAMWGALVTVALSLGGLFIDVSGIDSTELTNVLVSLSTGIAGLLALYGTITRKAPIDATMATPGVRWRAGRARTDAAEQLQSESLPTGSDAPETKPRRSGFPYGPFFPD